LPNNAPFIRGRASVRNLYYEGYSLERSLPQKMGKLGTGDKMVIEKLSAKPVKGAEVQCLVKKKLHQRPSINSGEKTEKDFWSSECTYSYEWGRKK